MGNKPALPETEAGIAAGVLAAWVGRRLKSHPLLQPRQPFESQLVQLKAAMQLVQAPLYAAVGRGCHKRILVQNNAPSLLLPRTLTCHCAAAGIKGSQVNDRRELAWASGRGDEEQCWRQVEGRWEGALAEYRLFPPIAPAVAAHRAGIGSQVEHYRGLLRGRRHTDWNS